MSATGPTSLSRQPDFLRQYHRTTQKQVLQYAGNCALRLANLGLSASSINRRVSRSLLAQPRDAALTAQRAARSRGETRA